ncbi:peptidyl-tRNA hydrolase [Mycoplasma haemocanis str. Illinois]|uniref:Peptidyl-tRNA hydrolase n=1 Tax=Mycoplasma haemocanis (strain Illinois) TaxID=1111676 RepID=H6N5H8_MYCHN|nr:aminoacyl-tRNA hydrolase [Mycoplasma haemocanis]AEW44938.1 peptidyl-tRNA hydrolase [Mycoplasma haemocanis str. Illinois]
MKVIVGLGNPGDKYECTHHNVGFLAIDYLLLQNSISSTSHRSFKSLLYWPSGALESVVFCKPQTFMNLSGEALRELKSFYKLRNSDFLVIYDDLYLETGKIKLSLNKGSSGHNGIKNIVAELGGNDFLKLRIGIGPRSKIEHSIADFVLRRIDNDDLEKIRLCFPKIQEVILDFLKGFPPDKLMNDFN